MARPSAGNRSSPFAKRTSLAGGSLDWPTPRAIRIVRPGQREFIVPLLTDREYQVGRAETVELYFGDETVSRVHGLLYFDAIHGEWVYRDAGSTVGSRLAGPRDRGQGEPISPGQETVVTAGCAVALGTGGSRIEFLEDVPSGAPAGAESGGPQWRSGAARGLEERLRTAGDHVLPLVLLGASGSGKTHVASRIHQLSGRRGRFVKVNCLHLPTDPIALQSELLGHVQDAFDGAVEARPGQLFLAHGGTLFLDEVDSLERDAQALLLMVLEGSEALVPVGAPRAAKGQPRPDFRLISASRERLSDSPLRRELAQRIGEGGLIQVPGLEERREDVPALALRFLEEVTAEQQVDCELSPDALTFLMDRKWPGQVRELRATVRTVAVRNWWKANGAGSSARRRVVIGVEEIKSYLAERRQVFGVPLDGSPPTASSADAMPNLPQARKRPADLTREELEGALRQAGGNKTRAAQALGISNATLRKKIEEMGL